MTAEMSIILQRLVLPPGVVLILMALAWWYIPRNTRVARYVLVFSILLLYVATIPVTATYMTQSLEQYPPLTTEQVRASQAQAIVVLGNGREPSSQALGGETLNTGGLERVRYASRLHNQTGLPILATGGSPDNEETSEAELMKKVLENEFRTSVRWVEEKSSNTWENALHSRQILAKNNIESIMLVTHTQHMPRAVWAFEKVGFKVIPAPTPYKNRRQEMGIDEWFPASMQSMRQPLHEYVGLFWYRLRHGNQETITTASAETP
ncbi:MAG: YdcF family protein [Magnetococcus sp. DMHC-1]|nr:YdcF family protein [Magnetococcales bacterium]